MKNVQNCCFSVMIEIAECLPVQFASTQIRRPSPSAPPDQEFPSLCPGLSGNPTCPSDPRSFATSGRPRRCRGCDPRQGSRCDPPGYRPPFGFFLGSRFAALEP